MTSVLVIGSGAREHALAWKIAQSSKNPRVIMAPGNDGVNCERWPVQLGDEKSRLELIDRSASEGIDLVVVGPDQALADGIVDEFRSRGVRVFGPTRAAAQIEASKSFAKRLMKQAGIPTAEYRVFERAEEARKFLKSVPWNSGWVVKADGLMLGKGVFVCRQLDQALDAVERLSGLAKCMVIEELLDGEEISSLAICDSETAALFPPARDYKRLLDRNEGPNTGGMGAFCPVESFQWSSWHGRLRREIFLPLLNELKKEGSPFVGVLYAGLMWNPKTDQLWVLEFNARFGDPEAQVLMNQMLESSAPNGDILTWLNAAVDQQLSALPHNIPQRPNHYSVYVVEASRGYPEQAILGDVINGIVESDQSLKIEQPRVYFAGVQSAQGHLLTNGGRVLGVVGRGATLSGAIKNAYDQREIISFSGMQVRGDIGQ